MHRDAAPPPPTDTPAPRAGTESVPWRTGLARAGFLVAVVALLFGRAVSFDFVNLDDPQYVSLNPHVTGGPTPENLRWAATTFDNSNWHPLTWWSWQLDTALWGTAPGGYHFTNILLHALNVLLVQRVLRQLTGRPTEAFLVALLFAIHPLRWESVAWISERKGLLSALGFLLAIDRYHAYVRAPGGGRMALVAGAAALSLMAKGMAVTLPCVLLVLDWRPYRRWSSPRAVLRLILEKWPLWSLTAIACGLTVAAQRAGGAVRDLEQIPFTRRLVGAGWAYLVYVGQTLWPSNLCVFYPIPAGWPTWLPVFALGMLGLLTAGAIAGRNRWPAVTAGWLCYLGMLVPVIGLVQVGDQAHADRYTYLPSIPLLVALGGIVMAATKRWTSPTPRVALVAAVALPLAIVSFLQGGAWRNTYTLWQQAVAAAPGNLSWWQLGAAEQQNRNFPAAVAAFREACRFAPDSAEDRIALAGALEAAGNGDEAEQAAREALALAAPEQRDVLAGGHLILGKGALRRGATEQGAKEFEEGLKTGADPALRSELAMRLLRSGEARSALPHLQALRDEFPESLESRGNLANAFVELGDWSSAAAEFEGAVRMMPRDPKLRSRWVTALLASGRVAEARLALGELLRLDPNWPTGALRGAAQMIASGSGPRSAPGSESKRQEGYWLAGAVALACEGGLVGPGSGSLAAALDVMAGGAAALGRFDEATRIAEQAAATARTAGDSELAAAIEGRLKRYRNREP